MGYSFTDSDASVAEAVRRIAVERIDSAVAALSGDAARAEAVHTVRKRCKQLRALISLVAPVFPDAKREDRKFRDISRMLAGARDAAVLATTFDELSRTAPRPFDRDAAFAVRQSLTERTSSSDPVDDAATRIDVLRRLADARVRAEGWAFDDGGWDALKDGLGKTYARARKRMKPAMKKKRDEETVHEWRKAAKAHGYHISLLRHVWDAGLKPLGKTADRLGDVLGQHHDLAALTDHLVKAAGEYGGPSATEPMVRLARARQAALEEEAHAIGARLFAEDAEAFEARLNRYWKEWRREAKSRAAERTPVPA